MLRSTLGILASLIFGSTLQFDISQTFFTCQATDAAWHVLQHKTGEKMVAVGGGGEVLSNVMQQ